MSAYPPPQQYGQQQPPQQPAAAPPYGYPQPGQQQQPSAYPQPGAYAPQQAAPGSAPYGQQQHFPPPGQQAAYGQYPPPQQPYGVQPQPQAYAQAPQGYAQPPPPQAYGQPQQYGQQPQQQYTQQPQQQYAQQQYAPRPSWAGPPERPWDKYGMSQEEYDQILAVFLTYDRDRSGKLNRKEMTTLARALNFAHTPQQQHAMFRDVDRDNSGTVTFDEFCSWAARNRPDPMAIYGLTVPQYQEVLRQFHACDANRDGLLNEAEWVQLSIVNGYSRSPPEAVQQFRVVDKERNGTVDLHELMLYKAALLRQWQAQGYTPQPQPPGPGSYAPQGYAQPPQGYAPPPPQQQGVPGWAAAAGDSPWIKFGLDQQEYTVIRNIFVSFDRDGSGRLDRNETTNLARYMNFARSPQELQQMFREMDRDGSGVITFDEFCMWASRRRPDPRALYGLDPAAYQDVMRQFHTYDTNRDGLINEAEFAALCVKFGYTRTLHHAQQQFRIVDKDRSGYCDLHELLLYKASMARQQQKQDDCVIQ